MHGGTIAAAEFFNEPTLAFMGGAPKNYGTAAFGQDFHIFDAFMRAEFPSIKLLAPGAVGESRADWAVTAGGMLQILPAADLATATRDADAFSYHHYGAVSQRCAVLGHQTSPEQALSEEWLGRTDQTLAYYRDVRDAAMPGKSFWNTETAEAACGGDLWAGTFLDTFRYLDQLGRLARQEVSVVIHNTLVASDYGLLDESSLEPKPNFWGALLWRKFMGTTVLNPGLANGSGMHVYAHCLRDVPGGVAMLILNTDRQKSFSLSLPIAAKRYTFDATNLGDKNISLNHKLLRLGAYDALPAINGEAATRGALTFKPASITFLSVPGARNSACGK